MKKSMNHGDHGDHGGKAFLSDRLRAFGMDTDKRIFSVVSVVSVVQTH